MKVKRTNRLQLEQVYFSILMGIETESNIKLFLDLQQKRLFNISYLNKIKKYFTINYKQKLRDKYKNKYPNEIIDKLDQFFSNSRSLSVSDVKSKQKSTSETQKEINTLNKTYCFNGNRSLLQTKSTINIKEQSKQNKTKKLTAANSTTSIFQNSTFSSKDGTCLGFRSNKVKMEKVTSVIIDNEDVECNCEDYFENNEKLLDVILDTRSINKKEYKEKVTRMIKETVSNIKENEVDLMFYLFIIKQLQLKENIDDCLYIQIFKHLHKEKHNEIINHLKQLATIFKNEKILNEYKYECEFPQKQKEKCYLIYYMNLITFINKPVTSKISQEELKKISFLEEESCDLHSIINSEAVNMILNHLDKYKKENINFFQNIFKCFVSKTKWYKDETFDSNEIKKEQILIITWIIEKIKNENLNLFLLDNDITSRISLIICVLIKEQKFSLIAYCLLSVVKKYGNSQEIIDQYNKIIYYLSMESIDEFLKNEKVSFCFFFIWMVKEEFSQNEKIKKLKHIKLDKNESNKNNSYFDIFCIILYWIDEHCRDEIISKLPSECKINKFISDVDNSKKPEIDPFRYINYNKKFPNKFESNYIYYKIIDVNNNVFNDKDNINKFKELFSNIEENMKMIFVECVFKQNFIEHIKTISSCNKIYELNGVILKEVRNKKNVFFVSKHKNKYYSLSQSKWLDSITLTNKEHEGIFVFIQRDMNSRNEMFNENSFIKTLKQTDEIYWEILLLIKNINPIIITYKLSIQYEKINFLIINQKNKSNNETNKNYIYEEEEQMDHYKKSQCKPINIDNNSHRNSNYIESKLFEFENLMKQTTFNEKMLSNELKNWIIQIAKSDIGEKFDSKIFFYIGVMIYYNANNSDNDINDLILNEQLGLNKQFLENLNSLKTLIKNEIGKDFIKLNQRIKQNKNNSKYNDIYDFLTEILILLEYLKNKQSQTNNEEIKKLIEELNKFNFSTKDEYIQQFTNYINKHKVSFPSQYQNLLNNITLYRKPYSKPDKDTKNLNEFTFWLNEYNFKENKNWENLIQWFNQKATNQKNENLCPKLALYIAIIITLKKNFDTSALNNILINNELQITREFMNNINKFQAEYQVKIEINLEQLPNKIKKSLDTEDNAYIFLLNILILLNYIYSQSQERIDTNTIVNKITELDTFRSSFNNSLFEGHLLKCMEYLTKYLFTKLDLDSFVNLNHVIINILLEHSENKTNKSYKERYDIINYFIKFALEHRTHYLEKFLEKNINLFHKLIQILFSCNEQSNIADLIMFSLHNFICNKQHNLIDILFKNKELKSLLRTLFYDKNQNILNILKYVIILFFFYYRSSKNKNIIYQMKNLEFQREEEINYFDIHLMYLYLNSEIRKYVFENKSILSKELIHIFESMKTNKEIDDSNDWFRKLRNENDSTKLSFINNLFRKENIVQIIKYEEIESIANKQENELPYLLYVKCTPSIFKIKNPLDEYKEITYNENIRLELVGVLLLFKEKGKVYSLKKNKYIYPIRDSLVYDKYSQHWYSLVNYKWQEILSDDVLANSMKAINLLFSKKIIKHPGQEIDINNLNEIQHIDKDKTAFDFSLTADWFFNNNKKLYYLYESTFTLFKSFNNTNNVSYGYKSKNEKEIDLCCNIS